MPLNSLDLIVQLRNKNRITMLKTIQLWELNHLLRSTLLIIAGKPLMTARFATENTRIMKQNRLNYAQKISMQIGGSKTIQPLAERFKSQVSRNLLRKEKAKSSTGHS